MSNEVNGLYAEEASTWLEKSIRAHVSTQEQRLVALRDARDYIGALIECAERDVTSCKETLDVIRSIP